MVNFIIWKWNKKTRPFKFNTHLLIRVTSRSSRYLKAFNVFFFLANEAFDVDNPHSLIYEAMNVESTPHNYIF